MPGVPPKEKKPDINNAGMAQWFVKNLGFNPIDQVKSQWNDNPFGFIPPNLMQSGKNAANLAGGLLNYSDAGDVKSYQDDMSGFARNLMGGSIQGAPEALTSMAALFVPGLSSRMAKDAVNIGRTAMRNPVSNAERGAINFNKISDNVSSLDEKIKKAASDGYNSASYLDGTGPTRKINDLSETDSAFVPGVSTALYRALDDLGVKSSGYPGGGTSDYFTIRLLDSHEPYDDIGEPNWNDFKIRVADHGNISGKYNSPDMNIAPDGNYTIDDALNEILSLVKSGRIEMKK